MEWMALWQARIGRDPRELGSYPTSTWLEAVAALLGLNHTIKAKRRVQLSRSGHCWFREVAYKKKIHIYHSI